MSSLNSCSFIGRVGKSVETKTLDNNNEVANFSLAISEKYKSGESTTWISCVAFGKLAEIIGKYVGKGDLLYVNGRLNNRQYEKDGVTKHYTEIVLQEMKMLGGKKDSSDVSSEVIEVSEPVKKGKKEDKDYSNDLPF